MSTVSAVHLRRPVVDRVKDSLRHATAEGMAYGAFLGLGDHFIGAFAVALQANSLEIGLLVSVPGLLASLAQLADDRLVRWFKSRKAVILVFALAQGLMLLPMLSLAFLDATHPARWLILFASLYSIFGAVTTPAWGSLMAEVVPANLRGRYFAMRGQLSTLSTLFAFVAGGVFLRLLVERDLWGFAILFGAGFGARFLSFALLGRLYEMPSRAVHRQPAAKVEGFAKGLVTTNLGRYMLFLFAMSFAVNISGPYFTVYLLRDLDVGYLAFTMLHALSPMANLLAVTHWGRAADKAGNLRVIFVASALVPMVPLLFVASSNLAFLGSVQVLSGLAWAGFNLCSVNYLYDATTPENRTRSLAYFSAGNGLAVGLGAFTGGYLAPVLPAIRGSEYVTLFLISGCLRAAVALAFLPFIKEVRRVSQVSAAELFHVMLGGRPIHGKMGHKRVHLLHPHEPPPRHV